MSMVLDGPWQNADFFKGWEGSIHTSSYPGGGAQASVSVLPLVQVRYPVTWVVDILRPKILRNVSSVSVEGVRASRVTILTRIWNCWAGSLDCLICMTILECVWPGNIMAGLPPVNSFEDKGCRFHLCCTYCLHLAPIVAESWSRLERTLATGLHLPPATSSSLPYTPPR